MSPDRDQLEPELESFRRVFEVGASIDPDDLERHDPPADLWERISARMEHDEPSVIAEDESTWSPRPARPDSESGGAAEAPVVDLAARRRNRTRAFLAAAAVLVAVASVGVVVSNQGGGSQELVASVELEVLQGSATGAAELIDVDGEQRLVITAEGMVDPPEGRHYEVWLIDEEITAPQSLGELTLADGTVSIVVPDGVDPVDFPILDINLQEDGVEEHSGLDTSVLRGVLS